jgi:hypothetical protein
MNTYPKMALRSFVWKKIFAFRSAGTIAPKNKQYLYPNMSGSWLLEMK